MAENDVIGPITPREVGALVCYERWSTDGRRERTSWMEMDVLPVEEDFKPLRGLDEFMAVRNES